MHLQKSWLVLFKMIVLWNRRRDAFEEVLARFVARQALDGRQSDPGTEVSEPLDVKLALQRPFWIPSNVFGTMERRFRATVDVKLAVERQF